MRARYSLGSKIIILKMPLQCAAFRAVLTNAASGKCDSSHIRVWTLIALPSFSNQPRRRYIAILGLPLRRPRHRLIGGKPRPLTGGRGFYCCGVFWKALPILSASSF
jgi:hypothetical protein